MSHDPQVKGAVMAALLAGQGVNSVADEFGIAKSVVSRWMKEETERTGIKKPSYADMIDAYLRESLITLRAQQEFCRDITWLRQQPASEVAVLHGVTADKVIKVLEAVERAQEPMSSPADSEAETVS